MKAALMLVSMKRHGRSEREDADGRGGGGADAGKPAQVRRAIRGRGPRARTTMSLAAAAAPGPPVVAEALPDREDLGRRRARPGRRTVGNRRRENSDTSSSTRATWVCCSMTSETRIS